MVVDALCRIESGVEEGVDVVITWVLHVLVAREPDPALELTIVYCVNQARLRECLQVRVKAGVGVFPVPAHTTAGAAVDVGKQVGLVAYGLHAKPDGELVPMLRVVGDNRDPFAGEERVCDGEEAADSRAHVVDVDEGELVCELVYGPQAPLLGELARSVAGWVVGGAGDAYFPCALAAQGVAAAALWVEQRVPAFHERQQLGQVRLGVGALHRDAVGRHFCDWGGPVVHVHHGGEERYAPGEEVDCGSRKHGALRHGSVCAKRPRECNAEEAHGLFLAQRVGGRPRGARRVCLDMAPPRREHGEVVEKGVWVARVGPAEAAHGGTPRVRLQAWRLEAAAVPPLPLLRWRRRSRAAVVRRCCLVAGCYGPAVHLRIGYHHCG
eukprot:513477-Rhodomonas_salina.1